MDSNIITPGGIFPGRGAAAVAGVSGRVPGPQAVAARRTLRGRARPVIAPDRRPYVRCGVHRAGVPRTGRRE
ncbi:hypothetical protein GCM10010231_56660 [Streptomyces sindenensis]|nr:hypothetical protein GCM10010231_56660 [Streptomyces sindenensis]